MAIEAREGQDVATKLADRSRIDRAMRLAARSAAIRHKREGVPLIVYEHGKVVEVPPDQIVIPPEE